VPDDPVKFVYAGYVVLQLFIGRFKCHVFFLHLKSQQRFSSYVNNLRNKISRLLIMPYQRY